MFHLNELKKQVRASLRGNWLSVWLLIGLLAIIFVSLEVISTNEDFAVLGSCLTLLLEGPLLIPFCAFLLYLVQQQRAELRRFFDCFSNFPKWMLAGLWQNLWLTLWTLLLVIPGIIKSFSYSQYYFILADAPAADLRQALRTSQKMTNGYKGDLLLAMLSFLPWGFFLAFTGWTVVAFAPVSLRVPLLFFISVLGYACLIPYIAGTFAGIYQILKTNALRQGICSPAEFGLEEVPQEAVSYDGQLLTVMEQPTEIDRVYYDEEP